MRGAAGAAVGGAALVAARLVSRDSRPKVLGVRIPNELNPQRLGASMAKHLDPKKLASHADVKGRAKDIDLKGVLRQIGNVAEHVEARSEEIHTLSGQAKRLSRRIS